MYSIARNKPFIPEIITVPTHGALTSLINSVNNDTLPTIDVEVLLAMLVDALMYKHGITEEMNLLINNIYNLDENICFCFKRDKENVPIQVLQLIVTSMNALTSNIFNSLNNHGMYVNDFLNYEFARIADNDSLLLRRAR